MSDTYNALAHYAGMRAVCVADIPEDIDLELLDLNADKRELLIKGIPETREVILSVYRSVEEYARDNFLTPNMLKVLEENGGFMKSNHTARIYLDGVFLSLLSILAEGELTGNEIVVTKDYLRGLEWPERQKIKYRHELTRHFEYFCRIECLKDGIAVDYKKCDLVIFTFDSEALLFTLRYLAQARCQPLHFQYGDLRLFSKSGRREHIERFPKSVVRKVIGADFIYYDVLKSMFLTYFNALPGGENLYQGGGYFQFIEEYEVGLKNTRTEITARKGKLILGVRMGFEEFERLPQIFGSLSVSMRNGFLATHQCMDCSLHCNSKRQVEFDEDIFPQRILKPCKCDVSELEITGEDDIKAVEILFEHMKRYGVPTKKHARLSEKSAGEGKDAKTVLSQF